MENNERCLLNELISNIDTMNTIHKRFDKEFNYTKYSFEELVGEAEAPPV